MANEVVVGATKKSLVVTIEDDDGNPVDLRGGSARLQGHSNEIPDADINEAGTLTDAQNGLATWAQLGTYVTEADIEGTASATYSLRVKYTDSGGLVDFGPRFQITWLPPPIATPTP